MSSLEFLEPELLHLRDLRQFRSLRFLGEVAGPEAVLEGQKVLVFCSNDYLGLSFHPALIRASVASTKEFGVGAGASRLVSGSLVLHQELESRLASFKSSEDAVLFSTGYMANVGTISALVKKGDAVILDRLNHASIIDGAKLSGARIFVYAHGDIAALEKVLIRSRDYLRRLVVTDSVFSMDGDLSPLPDIIELTERHAAILMIDDAHGTGVLGDSGMGAGQHWDVEGQIDVVMGTLSKALGGLGGFVCGSHILCDWLRNRARSFIYTTAPPPGVCAAAIAAIELLENEPTVLSELRKNCLQFADGLKRFCWEADSTTPIFPVVIGGEKEAVAVSQRLLKLGFFIPAIRPPTVPAGTSRLRITLSAAHTGEQIDDLLEALGNVLPDSKENP